ncbi:MAG: undecaprenyl-phosphate glucose phosphotransferase [Parvibaculum sp.]|nr:undecaprenyl-phosphate glucose phosphotransferase [Parvibaculum sp.]
MRHADLKAEAKFVAAGSHPRSDPSSGAQSAANDTAPGLAGSRLDGRRKFLPSRVITDVVMALDAAILFSSSLVAKFLYIFLYLGQSPSIDQYVAVGALGTTAALIFLRRQGLYSISLLSSFRGQPRRIVAGLLFSALLLVALGYLLKISDHFSRGWFLTWYATATIGLFVVHAVAVRVLRWLNAIGWFSRYAVVYGSGDVARALLQKISGSSASIKVIGVFDDAPDQSEGALPVAGGLSDLISFGQQNQIDEIIIALPMTNQARISNLVEQLSLLPVDIRLCPSAGVLRRPPKALLDYEGLTVLELESRPLEGWGTIVKVLEDRIIGSLALVVLMPVFFLIALAIKIESRGPILFKQRRHGFNHNVFTVYKFRTMNVVEDGPNVVQAMRNDPRITRVGRFLRKTSLDELPQLFNVLKGDMSLVGPRPHALAHNEYYSSVLASYAIRHKVKPGMTGWAQINGFRGETDTPEKMRQRLEHDLYYIENWSLWLDLKILFATPFFGLVGKNAY